MEFLLRFLDLATTVFEDNLVVLGLTTCRACLESGKWACVCQTAVDTHIMDERGDVGHLGNLRFRLSI